MTLGRLAKSSHMSRICWEMRDFPAAFGSMQRLVLRSMAASEGFTGGIVLACCLFCEVGTPWPATAVATVAGCG